MARFDLTDFEWAAIAPHLPNKPRGVPRVDDRRVLKGIFWRLRTGTPWADIPSRFEVVAKREGELVGFAGLYPQSEHMRHVGSLMLGVAAQAQGGGIGSFLLQLMVWTAWFVEGLSKVQLTVFSDNQRAVRLYEAAGF